MTTRTPPKIRSFAQRYERVADADVELLIDQGERRIYGVRAKDSRNGHEIDVTWIRGAWIVGDCDCDASKYINDPEGCVHRHRLSIWLKENETMTSTTELTRTNGVTPQVDLPSDEVMEMVIGSGDIGKLTSRQRVEYILKLCESLGLNPMSQPFAFISFQGKVVPYVRKDATDQLRKIHNVNIQIVDKQVEEGIYIVTARATMPNGRMDESTGALSIERLTGDAKANQIMKCETKAKRRVTLSICGLGFLDESEVSSIAGQEPVRFNHQTGDMDLPAQRPVNQVRAASTEAEDVSADEERLLYRNLSKACTLSLKTMFPDVRAQWQEWMKSRYAGRSYKDLTIEDLADLKGSIQRAVETAGSDESPMTPKDPEGDGVAQDANEVGDENTDPFA